MGSLEHDLAPHFDALRAMRTRKQLERSELWKRSAAMSSAFSTDSTSARADDAKPLGPTFRAAAWNIQRGTHLDRLIAAFRDDPELARADVLMLSEVDNGMGRSGNRHVARELADALGMGYAFAVSYVALEDDFGENADGAREHARARRQRDPVARADPAGRQRGRPRGARQVRLVGEAARPQARGRRIDRDRAGPVTFAQAHLDSNADRTSARASSRRSSTRRDRLGGPVVLGGDLNTTTYQYSSRVPARPRPLSTSCSSPASRAR